VIKSKQIRAGRELLGWSPADLAKAAALSKPTVERAERSGVSEDTLMRIRMALEKGGVIFVEGKGEAAGVRPREGEAEMKEPTTSALKSRGSVKLLAAAAALKTVPFQGCGFRDHTVKALIDCGIDTPEHLLFMAEGDLHRIRA
jgi:hypothetical protein